MRGPSQRFTLLWRMLFFKKAKGNRLNINFAGLFIVILLYFFVSAGIFFSAYFFIVKTENRLATDLKHTYAIRNDLVMLSSGLDLADQVLSRLDKSLDSISKNTKAQSSWRLAETKLLKLANTISQSGNEPEINRELVESGVIIDGLIRVLIEKRQTVNDKLLSRAVIYEAGWILITIILVCIGVILLTKSIKKTDAEIIYFENLAYQFKSGQFDKMELNYLGYNLTDLNQALTGYIRLLSEHYRSVKDQIKNLNFRANEIALFSSQCDTFYSDIRRDLEKLVAHSYSEVGRYWILAERIKSLNANLEDSQQQILVFQDSLKSRLRVFRETPETIKTIEIQVKKREQYLKKVIGALYQLQSILDQLFETGSVFQSVAEQNALLALNASIEAARAESAAEGFDIAAEEIAGLAEKMGRVSKELMAVVDLMGIKGSAALKNIQIDMARNNDLQKFSEAIGNKINLFCKEICGFLEEAIQCGTEVDELKDRRKSLENLAISLGDLNQQTQNNYGRAEAAIEVVKKAGETAANTEQLNTLIDELKQLMDKVVV